LYVRAVERNRVNVMCIAIKSRLFCRAILLVLFPAGFVVVACTPAGDNPQPVSASGSGVAVEVAPQAGGSAPVQAPAEAPAAGSGTTPGDGSSAAAIDVPSLESLMRRAGFGGAGQARPDEFVPVPPGATAEAGTFDNAERSVRAVLVRYPNARYARPHVTDVLERRRLLPQSGDAVLSQGPVVIQLQAATRDVADTLANELQRLLEWPALTDVQRIE
jgi:hypothetical protein